MLVTQETVKNPVRTVQPLFMCAECLEPKSWPIFGIEPTIQVLLLDMSSHAAMYNSHVHFLSCACHFGNRSFLSPQEELGVTQVQGLAALFARKGKWLILHRN